MNTSPWKRLLSVLLLCCSGSLFGAEHTQDALNTVRDNLKEKKAVLIDVREQDEWNEGHLKDATLVSMSKIKAGISPEELDKLFPKGQVIYLHCAAGGRCLKAADLLKKSGRDLRPLGPGFDDLVEAGFPKAD